MAYRKDRQRVLAGSMNLLPPADLTPPPDSLQLVNWRVDQAGQLRSRRGMSQQATGIETPIHSLFRVREDRYAGAAGVLRKGTAIETTLATGFDGAPLGFAAYQGYTWVMNRGKRVKEKSNVTGAWLPDAPSSAPVVALGAETAVGVAEFETPGETWNALELVDGFWQPAAAITNILTQQGSLAVTSASTAVVGTGTAFTVGMIGKTIHIVGTLSGNPYSHYTLVAAVADAEHLTLTVAWPGDTNTGLAFNITESLAASENDTVVKVSGTASTLVRARRVGRWRLERTAAEDLRIGGAIRGDDVFRFAIWLSDTQTLSQIKVIVESSGNGASAEAVFAAGYFAAAQGQWHVLPAFRYDLERRIQEATADGLQELAAQLSEQLSRVQQGVETAKPSFVLTNPLLDVDWAGVTRITFEVETLDALDFRLDKAEMVGGAAGSLIGEVAYYVTYDNVDGHETNPSPISGSVVVQKRAVSLTSIPVSADSGVTFKNIYRIGAGLDAPLRVGRILNATASLTDDVPNETALRDNIQMPINADPPPAARGLVGPIFARLLAFGSAAHVNRIWWTPKDQPWKWPGSDDEDLGNWFDVGEEGEEIYAVTDHKALALIYKAKSIWRLRGDPEEVDPERTNSSVGAVGLKAVANAGSVDYFVGPEGVYRFNGDYAEKISLKIDPIFKGDFTELGNAVQIKPLAAQYLSTCILEYIHGRLYFSYPEAGQTAPNMTLVWEEESGNWYQFKSALGGFTALYHEGNNQDLLGAVGNTLYRLETGLTDNGQAIPLVWQSAYLDQGLPEHEKFYADLVIDYQTALAGEAGPASTLQVKLLYDNGTIESVGALQANARGTPALIPLGPAPDYAGRKARNAALRIEGDATTTVVLYQVQLHFYPDERWAKTFDSGPIHLPGAGPHVVDALEFTYTSDAAVTFTLRSDLPSLTLEERVRQTIPNSGLFRVVDVQQFGDLALADVLGREFRLQLFSAGKFQIHRIRARVKPGGRFIAANEAFRVGPLVLAGAETPMLFGKVELDVDTDGSRNLRVTTELPGYNLTLRHTAAFDTTPTTAGRRPVNVRLPGVTKGVMLYLEIQTGAQACRLYGMRVWARRLGIADNWQWYGVPVEGAVQNWGAVEPVWVEIPVEAIE